MRRLTPYVFIAPGFLLFLGLVIYPTLSAFRMSLYDWAIVAGKASTFIGLDNFARGLQDPVFLNALANTLLYMAVSVPAQILLGLGIALLLRRSAPANGLFRTLYYLPVVTSWVVSSLLFTYLFSDAGPLNWIINDVLRIGDQPVSWLADRWTGLAAIIALGVWKGAGWAMVIMLAALQAVPAELEEAAMVDGANRRQVFRHVTLPAIRAALAFLTVILVIGGFNVFTSVLLMTDGGPGNATQVLLTYMYKQAFENFDFGHGSAIAVMLTVFLFALSVGQLRLFSRRDPEESML